MSPPPLALTIRLRVDLFIVYFVTAGAVGVAGVGRRGRVAGGGRRGGVEEGVVR